MSSNEITKKPLVYQTPETALIQIQNDLEYRVVNGRSLTLDLYRPPDSDEAPTPAVIFVSGYSDVGFQRMLGCKLKDMESYVSWGKLAASIGLTGITCSAVEPVTDTIALFDFVMQNASLLKIDAQRIGIWSCSGNSPNALSLLIEKRDPIKFAVFFYGVMMDLDGHNGTAQMARQFGFVNPCDGRSIEDLPTDVPIFIARAGEDAMPRLNETLERFLSQAVSRNLPVTFVNHPTAPHAFDVLDDSETSREIIKSSLSFMRDHTVSI
jgi:hypothetical protein